VRLTIRRLATALALALLAVPVASRAQPAAKIPRIGWVGAGSPATSSDLPVDYTDVGQTPHLAARMEQIVAPGAIVAECGSSRPPDGTPV